MARIENKVEWLDDFFNNHIKDPLKEIDEADKRLNEKT